MGVFYLGFLPPDCLDTHGLFGQDGKAKAAETHEKAPDAGRLTFQNVGLHFSFVESVGL